jgi:hypothetical protein
MWQFERQADSPKSDPILLQFDALSTEDGKDVVRVFEYTADCESCLDRPDFLDVWSSDPSCRCVQEVHSAGYSGRMSTLESAQTETESGNLAVVFISDGQQQEFGFQASVSLVSSVPPAFPAITVPRQPHSPASESSVVSETCTVSPTIVRVTSMSAKFSPVLQSEMYQANAECRWLLISDGPIELTFDSFSTEAATDTVSIFDGSSECSPKLVLSGPSGPEASIFSSRNTLLVVFVSDWQNQGNGFVASARTEGAVPRVANPDELAKLPDNTGQSGGKLVRCVVATAA